jgi:hypothetical protein
MALITWSKRCRLSPSKRYALILARVEGMVWPQELKEYSWIHCWTKLALSAQVRLKIRLSAHNTFTATSRSLGRVDRISVTGKNVALADWPT